MAVTANVGETLTHAKWRKGTSGHKTYKVHSIPGGNCPQLETTQIPRTLLSRNAREPRRPTSMPGAQTQEEEDDAGVKKPFTRNTRAGTSTMSEVKTAGTHEEGGTEEA